MPIETFYIISSSTHNKQQAGNKIICTEERGKKVMTATNICANLGGKWYSPPVCQSNIGSIAYAMIKFAEYILLYVST